ncbi:MAG: tripartite tricarboxylate transporter permease [Rhodoferax sp.]|nr:tripartite tricarboxylate transporter permease [Rhodoferax sp.]
MDLLSSFQYLLGPWPLFLCVLGTALGIIVGAIPGLSGAMLIALTLPLTFKMVPEDAMALLVSMYTGSITGGFVSAVLLRIPGTPSNVITVFDGYAMAQKGHAGRALGLGIAASFVGAVIAWVALVFLTKPLADVAVQFTPFDYFALVLTALVLISSVSGKSMTKGLLAGMIGVLFAFPGLDDNTGSTRFTFGMWQLTSGFDILPVLVGVFGIGTVMAELLKPGGKGEVIVYKSGGLWMKLSEWKSQFWNLLRSSVIGTWIGILPGVGASVGSLVAYTVAKNVSRTPEEFGTGSPSGIVASEAANNATVGGALIPLLAIGIPGSVIDVFLMGAMMIHGIQPGPLLFEQHASIVYVVIAACLLSSVLMFGQMYLMIPFLRRVLDVPRHFVLPLIMVFCVVGVFASSNRMFDVWIMLGFGVLGFLMERGGLPLGPFVIGFILAPIAESRLRQGLMMTDGSFMPLVTQPLTLSLLVLSVLLLFWPFFRSWRMSRR